MRACARWRVHAACSWGPPAAGRLGGLCAGWRAAHARAVAPGRVDMPPAGPPLCRRRPPRPCPPPPDCVGHCQGAGVPALAPHRAPGPEEPQHPLISVRWRATGRRAQRLGQHGARRGSRGCAGARAAAPLPRPAPTASACRELCPCAVPLSYPQGRHRQDCGCGLGQDYCAGVLCRDGRRGHAGLGEPGGPRALARACGACAAVDGRAAALQGAGRVQACWAHVAPPCPACPHAA